MLRPSLLWFRGILLASLAAFQLMKQALFLSNNNTPYSDESPGARWSHSTSHTDSGMIDLNAAGGAGVSSVMLYDLQM